MRGIKLPATLRWAAVNCLLIWMAMSVYRGFLLGIFRGKVVSKISLLLKGVVVDAGVAGYILVLFVLLTLYAPLHPYKTRSGKAFGYVYFIFWMLLVAIAFGLDVIFLKSVHYRAYGSKLPHLLQDPLEAESFFRAVSLMPLVLVVLLIVWIWAFLIRWLHSYLGRMARTHSKTKRLGWQVGIIAVGSVVSIVAIITALQINPSDLNIRTVPWRAFSTNPLLNLFFV